MSCKLAKDVAQGLEFKAINRSVFSPTHCPCCWYGTAKISLGRRPTSTWTHHSKLLTETGTEKGRGSPRLQKGDITTVIVELCSDIKMLVCPYKTIWDGWFLRCQVYIDCTILGVQRTLSKEELKFSLTNQPHSYILVASFKSVLYKGYISPANNLSEHVRGRSSGSYLFTQHEMGLWHSQGENTTVAQACSFVSEFQCLGWRSLLSTNDSQGFRFISLSYIVVRFRQKQDVSSPTVSQTPSCSHTTKK